MVDAKLGKKFVTRAIAASSSNNRFIGMSGFALAHDSAKVKTKALSAQIDLLAAAIGNLARRQSLAAENKTLRAMLWNAQKRLIVSNRHGTILFATPGAVSALRHLFDSDFRNVSFVLGLSLPSAIMVALQAGRSSVRIGVKATVLIKSVDTGRRSVAPPLFQIELLVEQTASVGNEIDISRLSTTETEILALVRQGLTNRQIADCRGVSPLTTQNQVHHIFEKTGASNRRELMLAQVASIPEPLLITPIKNNQP